MYFWFQALDDTIESGNFGSLLGFFPIDEHNIIQYRAQEFVFSDMARRLDLRGPDAFIEAARLINHYAYGEPMILEKDGDDATLDLENLAEGSNKFVEELVELSVPLVNGEGTKRSPKSLLPSCDWDISGKCWTRVVTDQGLCFTNYYRDGL